MSYYIVLHLYICIALIEVHANRKRFQCDRNREKRVHVNKVPKTFGVLRGRKEALGSPVGSPVNMVDRIEGGSWFQIAGPLVAMTMPCHDVYYIMLILCCAVSFYVLLSESVLCYS